MSRRRAGILGLAALAVAATAVVVVLLATGDGDGSQGWGPPAPAPFAQAGNAAAGVAGDGTVVVAWSERRRGRSSVMASERPPGGEWSDPVAIQPPQEWDVRGPSIAVGARGDAVVTFAFRARQDEVLLAAYRPAGEEWEEPQALAPARRGLYDAEAAPLDGGGVVVAWSQPFGTRGVLAASTRPAGSPWTDGVNVRPPGAPTGDPRLAVAPDGRVYLATVAFTSLGRPALRVFERRPGGGWTWLPVPGGAAPGRRDADVTIAADGAGEPVLAWTSIGAGGVTTLWTSRRDAGTWTAPRRLDRAPDPSFFGRLTAGRAGDGAAVAWTRWERMWERASVRTATADGPAVTVDAFDVPDIRGGNPGTSPGPPPGRVLLAGGDRPVLAWDRLVTREPAFSTRMFVSAAGAGGWGAPEAVATEPSSGGWPLAAGRTEDEGLVAAWARYARPGGPGLQVLAAERPG